MSIEHVIRAVAGTLILASLSLGTFAHPYWYLVGLFVGANLLQSAFTKWCLLEILLQKYVYHTAPRG
jgi:hypothetical protein